MLPPKRIPQRIISQILTGLLQVSIYEEVNLITAYTHLYARLNHEVTTKDITLDKAKHSRLRI